MFMIFITPFMVPSLSYFSRALFSMYLYITLGVQIHHSLAIISTAPTPLSSSTLSRGASIALVSPWVS